MGDITRCIITCYHNMSHIRVHNGMRTVKEHLEATKYAVHSGLNGLWKKPLSISNAVLAGNLSSSQYVVTDCCTLLERRF